MFDSQAAMLLLSCLDLTSLGKDDNQDSIIKLCNKAQNTYGNVAAVCVYPKFISLVKKQLEDSGIKIASVVNFPTGEAELPNIKDEIKKAIGLGADEIDAVFPYKSFLSNDIDNCQRFLELVKKECGKQCCKIILETGELKHSRLIHRASELCIDYEVDFIKTSTGKTPISATTAAANAILETIFEKKSSTGFKASGGIKSFEDARQYMVLAQDILGENWVNPQKFRIGASSLIDNLSDVIKEGY